MISNKRATSLGATALLVAVQSLLLASTAGAETVARAQGRCKLTSGDYKAFDGHCTVKQKQQGNTMSFVVELDNGSHYRFFGANKQALQVETHDGIHNVQFQEDPDKGVFTWAGENQPQRLSVKLDTQHPPNVSHDSTTDQALGTLIGAGVGALIGNLLSGGNASQLPSKPSHTVSDAKVPGTNYHATGNVPCKMTREQPMGSCPFGVTRRGNGTADVTVTKPDGRKRVIFFENGNAIGADTSQADPGNFRAKKQGDLSIVHIGQEVYEIPEVVVFGD
jgi:hypothetical protein